MRGLLQTWARRSQFMRLATLVAFSAAAVSALTSGGKEATKRLQVWDSGRRAEALLEATGVYDRSMAAPFVNNFILGRTAGDEICRASDTNPMNGCSMVSSTPAASRGLRPHDDTNAPRSLDRSEPKRRDRFRAVHGHRRLGRLVAHELAARHVRQQLQGRERHVGQRHRVPAAVDCLWGASQASDRNTRERFSRGPTRRSTSCRATRPPTRSRSWTPTRRVL